MAGHQSKAKCHQAASVKKLSAAHKNTPCTAYAQGVLEINRQGRLF